MIRQLLTNKLHYRQRHAQPLQSWTENGHSGGSDGCGQSIFQAKAGMDWSRWALMNWAAIPFIERVATCRWIFIEKAYPHPWHKGHSFPFPAPSKPLQSRVCSSFPTNKSNTYVKYGTIALLPFPSKHKPVWLKEAGLRLQVRKREVPRQNTVRGNYGDLACTHTSWMKVQSASLVLYHKISCKTCWVKISVLGST